MRLITTDLVMTTLLTKILFLFTCLLTAIHHDDSK